VDERFDVPANSGSILIPPQTFNRSSRTISPKLSVGAPLTIAIK